ncbi:carbohydrate ABC transporter substrate-binding protein [Proteiniclasticum sp.]|uniref:carbohydrate ABC transporter substrate-binding protein n=1 Tax=Proteiniclasticum sp. TaxID=2053595 RepID=UPI00289B78BD|nr:carbohydrate ABC transporter substrate-binding protein [Proteiniclasticum sp.]
MKKILALLMSITLVVGLSACGQKTEDDPVTPGGTETPLETPGETEERTLKIAGLDGGYGKEHWMAVAEKFEANNPGVTVELTLEKNIEDVLRPQIQAMNVPDLMYISVGREGMMTETLIKENAVVDITDVLSMKVPGEEVTVGEKIIPGFTDTLITNPYGDGKTYLAPLFYGPTGLFYNSGLVGEGKTYALPETFEELFALNETAKANGSSLFTYPTTGYFDAFFYALVNEVGGADFFNKAMTFDVETWNSDTMKEVFAIVGELVSYNHPDTVAQANNEGFTKNQQLILDNKALFIPNGTWLPGEMEKAPRAEGFEWGFTALPAVEKGGDRYSYTFFEQMYIPEGAKEADLAKEFIAYMYSDEAAKIIYEKSGAVMPVTTASSFMTDEDPNKLYYSVYDDGAKAAMGGFQSAPAVEGVDLVSSTGILFGTINSVATGDKTVDTWHQEVVDAVTKISAAMNN